MIAAKSIYQNCSFCVSEICCWSATMLLVIIVIMTSCF